MNATAVTVCVNYSDYLALTLPLNAKKIDRFVVVTTEDDTDTLNLCKKHGTDVVLSRRLHENGAPFAKGKAINEAISEVMTDTKWLLHLDADVILPPAFKDLPLSSLDNNILYHAERFSPPSGEVPELMRLVNTSSWDDVLLRWYTRDSLSCYAGFFQLFSLTSCFVSNRPKVYPESSNDASVDDWELFCSVYGLANTRRLPKELAVVHLPHGGLGTNWGGRKSAAVTRDER